MALKPQNNQTTPLRMRSLPAPYINDASGLPMDADAPQRRHKVPPISTAIDAVMKHFALGTPSHTASDAMVKAWPELAGKELCEKLKLDKFENGVLYVLARNNTELFDIRAFKLKALEQRVKKHPAFQGLRQIRIHCC